MRQPLVAGNWKMHGTKSSSIALAKAIAEGSKALAQVEIAVFPPYAYLDCVATILQGSSVNWGAQNVASELEGAYTGEVSAPMLLDFHCKYVLIGHSERRRLYGEDDAVVARKFVLASQSGLNPILCLGETQEERQQGFTEKVIKRQLSSILQLEQGLEYMQNAVIAYEPVWAIGTGVSANPTQAQAIHKYIRNLIRGYNALLAETLRIIYGGSIKATNAADLFAQQDIDGGLVGGASLNIQEFLEIGKCSNSY